MKLLKVRVWEAAYGGVELTKAERTVYWFLYGKRFSSYPEHPNCRCAVVDMDNVA